MKETNLDRLINEYEQKVKEFYPGFRFSQRRSIYSGEEPTSCHYEFSLNAKNLNGTEYHTNNKFDIIHYTPSIQNAIEILNSGTFRLSNLITLNDPQEINFVTKSLDMKFTADQIHEYKSHFFSASFCEVSDENKPDDFPMWRLYGNDGYGVALVFEIINFQDEWSNFLLSKVQYGDNTAVKRFKDFIDFHNHFQQANNYPIQNIPKAICSLMALHKNNIWQHEKEIRLLTHHEFDKYTLKSSEHNVCDLKHSIYKTGDKFSYVELPIYKSAKYNRFLTFDFHEQLLTFIPILKVKSVILGYRHSQTTRHNIYEIVRHFSDVYEYNINASISHLSEYM